MKVPYSNYLNDRLEEGARILHKTNKEYALAIAKRRELSEKLNPIIMGKKVLTLDECDLLNIQEYIEQWFIITGIEQQFFYTQGYLDCVDLLKTMGVLR